MSDLLKNHIVGFLMRQLIFQTHRVERQNLICLPRHMNRICIINLQDSYCLSYLISNLHLYEFNIPVR